MGPIANRNSWSREARNEEEGLVKLRGVTSTTEAWQRCKLLRQWPNPKLELMDGTALEPATKHKFLRKGKSNWTEMERRGVAENFSQ